MKFTNLFAVASIASIIMLSGCTSSSDTGQNTKLAECLTKQSATMYGTNRCSHCQAQKDLFGYAAFTKINFVDCDKEKNVCNLAGVSGYPTWKFANGTTLVGEQTFEALGQAAGCSLDGTVASTAVSTGSVSDVVTGELLTGVTGGVVSFSSGELLATGTVN